jgi:heptaprenyl diphosphate synthase
MSDTRRLIILGLFVAVAGVLHAVEGWLPLPVPVPGVKLGLANIVTLAVIVLYGWRDALTVAVVRVVLGTLLGGAFLGPSFALGLSGAVASTLAMAYACHRWQPALSLVGVSVVGAAVHNIAQISVASLLVVNAALLWYLPYLILFALPTGLATGFTAAYFLAKLPRDGG